MGNATAVALAAALLLALAPAARADAGGGWAQAPALGTDVRSAPVLVRGPDGEVAAVWREPARIAAALLRPDADGFGASFAVAPVSGQVDLRAAFGPDGTLTVAWLQGSDLEGTPSSDVTVRAVRDVPGEPFGEPQVIGSPERHAVLDLAAGPDGAAYLVVARRRASERTRYDLLASGRPAGAERFGPPMVIDDTFQLGLNRSGIGLAALAGAGTVVYGESPATLGVVDVAPEGGVRTRSTVQRAVDAPARVVALSDGTTVVSDPAAGADDATDGPARVRLRPPSGAFGAPIGIPGFASASLAAAGGRLAAVTSTRAAADAGRPLGAVGFPGALSARVLGPEGQARFSEALAGAPDGRALAVLTTIARGDDGARLAVQAAVASPGEDLGAATELVPPAADDTLAAGALGARLAVAAVGRAGRILVFLKQTRAASGDGDDAGTSDDGSGGRCPAVRARRTRTLAAGRVRVRFRDLGGRVALRSRPVLRLRAVSSRGAIRRVELRAAGRRVRDASAPYRLRLPRTVTARAGTRTLLVRLVTRSGATRALRLRVRVGRCG